MNKYLFSICQVKLFILVIVAIIFSSARLVAATIYSAGSGNWNSTSTWVGGTVPGTSDDAIITDEHSVTVTDTRTVSSITIENSSDAIPTILIVNSGITLTISNNLNISSYVDAATVRFDNNGTVVINGNIVYNSVTASDARIRMLNGSSLTLYGTINNNTLGNITSSSGITSTFTFAGSSSQTIPTGTGYSFHNLVINKSGTNAATINAAITSTKVRENITVSSGIFSNGGFSIAGAAGKTFTVQSGGSFMLTGTSSLPTTFTHDFQSGSTIIYDGTNTIVNPNSGNFSNITIQSSGTKTLGANITINGNLTLAGGTLDVSATPYNIDIKGNWNNTGGTLNARNGTVTFSGTSSQSISTNAQDYYNLTINNTTSGTSAITFNSDVTATGTCTLTDGIINTGSNKLIISNTNAANLTGYSSACYVNGNLRRSITNNTSTYGFPVGTVNYQLIEIKNNNMTTTTTLDAKFGPLFNSRNEDLSVCDGSLCYLSVSNSGMWTIDANANPGSGSYDVYAYIANISGLIDNEFAILKRPTGSTTAADWIAETAGTINADNGDGRLVSHSYALRKTITAFSEFSIGRKQSASSLPIQLVEIKAQKHRTGRIDILWTTATEINNDFFTIERSHNGVNFETLTTVAGAGNSNDLLHYSTIDNNPLRGINYYRLKQTDYDGTSTHSKIISIDGKNISIDASWKMFPNPVIRGTEINLKFMKVLPERKYTKKKFLQKLILYLLTKSLSQVYIY
jgi:fibronectin-binding autotransporter adhesin